MMSSRFKLQSHPGVSRLGHASVYDLLCHTKTPCSSATIIYGKELGLDGGH